MLHLQELVKEGQHNRILDLSQRLPHFILMPCHLNVAFKVEAREDYYLIHLHVQGDLTIQCQRCLDEFHFPYDNNTDVAVCRDDKRAEKVLEHYECIVSANLQVSLKDMLIDELHLYAPQFHLEISDCRNEINQILSRKK